MYSELQDSRLTLMEVMDEYVERRVLSEEDHNRANSFMGSKSNAIQAVLKKLLRGLF